MGMLYLFNCKACTYEAEVSGGHDCGMEAVVNTCICSDCQSLVDVLVGRYGVDGPTGDKQYDAELNRCPECQSGKVIPWPKTQPCPKCEKPMFKDDSFTGLWD